MRVSQFQGRGVQDPALNFFMINNRFLETIKEYDMLEPGERVLIGVSGGVDSVALLNLLHANREKLGISLHIAHLNHMIRRDDAETDLRFVQNLAQNLRVPISVEAIDVQAFAKEKKLSLETAARQVRYDFFARIAGKAEASKIAVGHSADDNVETFLMRLLRGTGIKGLCGIPPRRGKIIRPLIRIWRKEIEEYVGGLKLVPRRDHTNYESKYLRNRVRMKLLPQLKLYNLNIKEIILNTILLLTEDSLYLENRAETTLEECLRSSKEEEISLKVSKLKDLEQPILGHLLRLAIQRIKGNLLDLSYVHIREVMGKIGSTESWELHLPDGIYAVGNEETLLITQERPQSKEVEKFYYKLPVPGEVFLREVGRRIKSEVLEQASGLDYSELPPHEAYIDFYKVGKEIVVRNRREGDRFSPLGIRGTKKVQDFFIDEKVALEERGRIPILESAGRIIWVAGMRVDERFKITPATRKVLKLQLL